MATRAPAPTRKRAGGTEDGDVDPALPQKKRARHRLIGAIALCLLAAIVVPLLLESEPTRPASDVAIVVPSRDTPLPPRTPDGKAAPASPSATPGRAALDAPAGGPAGGAAVAGASAKGADARAVDAKPGEGRAAESKSGETKPGDAKSADAKSGDAKPADSRSGDARTPDAKAATRPDARKDEIGQLAEAAQAKARGEATGRYLLQVGAFGNETGAATAIDKVEAAGLRAFTEKIKTDRGERVRVRVGPFPSRDAAEQARARLKAAGLEAAVIAP